MERTIRMYESPLLAQKYSKYRPTYPQTLWDKIFAFAEKHGTGFKMALDLACGTGHSTLGLCGHYQRTVGVDISKAQLEYAKERLNDQRPERCNNVDFILSTASQIPIPERVCRPSHVCNCLALAWSKYCIPRGRSSFEEARISSCIQLLHSHNTPWKMQQDIPRVSLIPVQWQEGPYGNVLTVCDSHYREVRLPYPIAERHEMEVKTTMSLGRYSKDSY